YDPAALLSFLCAYYPDILCSDFTELAEDEGTYRAANVAMLGAAAGARALPFPEETLKAVLDAEIPEKYRAVNKAAFERARKCIRFVSDT
ncbi:MAG TPA: 2-oxoacid:acceptor oxidoreductase family protein, partial [Methanosarcina sp.]|nr:2-oxoacid:acceptor oxidoreductase family protein [Methanosarcina sp.]